MIQDFNAAARQTLAFLHQRFGFQLWLITRTEGDDWIVLEAEDHGYGVKAGNVFCWADSFCSRMVAGAGPSIAPRSDDIAAFASAPISAQIDIGAYIGIPLRRTDGSLFGTLCAIDPLPQSEEIRAEQPLLELLADLLARLLNAELGAAEALRRAERAAVEATRDALTSLYNRRGWDTLLQREEERCGRYGHPACVISIDLDELKSLNDTAGHAAGDALLVRASQALQAVTRAADVVARLGGDEFAVLATECDAAAAQVLLQRLQRQFALADVKASIGLAMRDPQQGLRQAFAQADAEMYKDKKNRKRQG